VPIADVAGYFTGTSFGFDACETPSISTMNTWKTTSRRDGSER
jgi:hypothetical protein